MTPSHSTLCLVKNGPPKDCAIKMSILNKCELRLARLIPNKFLKLLSNFVEKYYFLA